MRNLNQAFRRWTDFPGRGTARLGAFLLLCLAGALPARAATKSYCVNVDDSAVPALVNDRKLTLNVNVGSCGSVSVTADGNPVSATYNSSTGTASFTTTGSSITVYALNWTSGGTGAVTKATLYNNFHWAYSLTFDDNRQTQYDNGKPLLDAHGWKAGEAVVNSWVGNGSYYMTWAEIKNLLASGWSIYNHTNTHPNPVNCSNFNNEFTLDQNAFLTQLPGYHVSHIVYPYEVSSVTSCAGFPLTFLISGEVGGSGYTYVDTAIPNVFLVPRNGLYGTDPTSNENTASSAANNSRPTWMITITHSVTAGSGAAEDAYSTNQACLTSLFNYLDSHFGASGNNSMWFAPSGEVMDYIFTRDNAVVSTCSVGSPVPTDTPTRTPTLTPTLTPVVSSTWRVNAGGPNYTDTQGNLWVADTNYSGGSTIASGGTISGTSDSTLYDTQRYGSPFSYSFNVPPGSYQVTLLFAETYSGDFSTGARIISVSINGTVVSPSLDVYSQVGSNAADDLVYNNVSPSGGVITIQFASNGGTDANAVIEALQVIPMPATPTPTATSSPTSTATRTATSTPTRTATATATNTLSPTASATPTASPSTTPTSSPTRTATGTATSTATNSPTLMNTATSTGTATPSSTATSTATYSPTLMNTATSTRTATSTLTATPSSTPAGTPTFTPSPFFTFTPTPSSTATNSATDTPTLVNTATPSSTPTETATSTLTATPSSTPTGTPTFTPSPFFTFTPTPFSTATPTPADTATASRTPTETATSTWSPTSTPTASATPSPSPTETQTFTPSPFDTFTPTPSFTATSTPGPVPVVYPNPADGTRPVTLDPALSGESRVRVEFFTVAFRKVQDLDFPQVSPGQALSLPVEDHWGRPLASGLYYLRVSTDKGRFTVKLLVLR